MQPGVDFRALRNLESRTLSLVFIRGPANFGSSVLITVVSVRVRGSYTHSANTTVRVAPVQVPAGQLCLLRRRLKPVDRLD